MPARAAIVRAEAETGLVADDPVRFGADRMLDAVLAALDAGRERMLTDHRKAALVVVPLLLAASLVANDRRLDRACPSSPLRSRSSCSSRS